MTTPLTPLNNLNDECSILNSDFEHKIKIIAGSGCYSYVGFQGIREQTISLREVGCLSRGTVQHEFMHALGFYHEQARPDAKEHVKIQE